MSFARLKTEIVHPPVINAQTPWIAIAEHNAFHTPNSALSPPSSLLSEDLVLCIEALLGRRIWVEERVCGDKSS